MAKNNETTADTKENAIHLFHPTRFIEYWVKRNNLKLLANGQFAGLRTAQIIRQMWLGYIDQAMPKRFSKQDLADAVVDYCERYKLQALTDLKISLQCEFENLAPLEAWLQACTGKSDALNTAVWAHTICNLKRKLFGLESYYEMMPVLVGKQGSGKSRAIIRLLEPIKDVSLFYTVDQATDERIAINFSNNFACFFDELAKGDKADIGAIKNLISRPRSNIRLMRENETDSFEQSCTFFGASNKSVAEVFYDTTGARRFYDTQTADLTDRTVINSIDYLELFKGVDEKRDVNDSYLTGHEEALESIQSELVADDLVAIFVETRGWKPGIEEQGVGDFVSMEDITMLWNIHAEKHNLAKYTSSWIGQQLRRLGFKPATVRRTGKRGRYIVKNVSDIQQVSGAPYTKVLK